MGSFLVVAGSFKMIENAQCTPQNGFLVVARVAGDGREKRGEGEEDRIWNRSKSYSFLHESKTLEIMLAKDR